MSAIAIAAAEYGARGFAVLPLKPRSKEPDTRHGKNDASTDPAKIAAWFPDGSKRNVGILTGEETGLIVVDIDPRNDGTAGLERLERTYGALPHTMRAETGGGGFHLFYSIPVGSSGLKDRPNVAGFRGVDIKASGYIVAAPSVHASGKSYEWDGDFPIAEAPEFLVDLARGSQRIKQASYIANASVVEGSRNDTLFRLGSGLRARGLSSEAILAAVVAENAARCVPPLSDEEVNNIVKSAMRYEPGTHFPETELGNSRRLVERMAGDMRYQPASRTWYCWDDRHWLRDDEGEVSLMAKRVVDGLLSEAKLVDDMDSQKRRVAFAHKSQSAARIGAMIELAKTEPGIPIKFDAFDLQPHLLNVANGMIDLRTGALLPHDRNAFASQLIDVEYDPTAPCPIFDQFVSDILSNDVELVDYVQRAIGYAATGDTREQSFFILHGDGANGKSTFLNVIRSLLGGYAKHTPTDTLIAKTSSASNDLARLAGTRFVTASEANADQRLADSLLKQVTGDEPITARFLFKEFISFRPTFKLFLATNQLPQINGSDPAMWRRIRTIPFNRVFTPEQQDRELADKLALERAGILAWIVRGAVSWYAGGLSTPAAVQMANAEYRAEMDSIGQFIEERCEISAIAVVSASGLYASYRFHSNDNGHTPVTPTTFGRTLTQRGFRPEKRSGMKYRVGLAMRSAFQEKQA